MNPQVLVGALIVVGCLLGWRNESLILKETFYGSLLRRLCGERWAGVGWRVLLLIGGVGGVLLATDVVRPLRW